MDDKENKNNPEIISSMSSYLNLVSECTPPNKRAKNLWYKALTYMKKALSIQKEDKITKMIEESKPVMIIQELHRILEKKYSRSIQVRLIEQLCRTGYNRDEIENEIKKAVETFDGKISCIVPKCTRM